MVIGEWPKFLVEIKSLCSIREPQPLHRTNIFSYVQISCGRISGQKTQNTWQKAIAEVKRLLFQFVKRDYDGL